MIRFPFDTADSLAPSADAEADERCREMPLFALPHGWQGCPGKAIVFRKKRVVRSSFLRSSSVGTQKVRATFFRKSLSGETPRPACGRAIAFVEISDDEDPLPSPGGGGSARVVRSAT